MPIEEEHAFLQWFYDHVDPDMRDRLKSEYAQHSGKRLPNHFCGPMPGVRHIAVRTLGMVINFASEDTRQFHRDLCEVYNTEELLVTLIQRLGISPVDIPFKSTLRDTWQATLIDLYNRNKIGELLNLVSW